MEFSSQLPVECGRILNISGNIGGTPAFLFSIAIYFNESQARQELGERGRQLKETLFCVAHLRKLAKDLEQHSATV